MHPCLSLILLWQIVVPLGQKEMSLKLLIVRHSEAVQTLQTYLAGKRLACKIQERILTTQREADIQLICGLDKICFDEKNWENGKTGDFSYRQIFCDNGRYAFRLRNKRVEDKLNLEMAGSAGSYVELFRRAGAGMQVDEDILTLHKLGSHPHLTDWKYTGQKKVGTTNMHCLTFRPKEISKRINTLYLDPVTFLVTGWLWEIEQADGKRRLLGSSVVDSERPWSIPNLYRKANYRVYTKDGSIRERVSYEILSVTDQPPVADAEFTLSHYGFPEPGETIKPTWQPSPLYIGAFVVGLALLVVSAWLLRRRQKSAV